MIQIYIDNKLIDLDNTNISLQKEFEDEVENIPTEIEYSFSISIPTTLKNKEIFGFVDTFDVSNKFSRLYNAELYVDETLIIKGKFKMTSIEDSHFKGNIYNPKSKTVSDILGDRQLNEIKPHYKPMNSLTDYGLTNNYVCNLGSYNELTNNWGDVEGVIDDHVVYPYILYGLPMNDAEANPDLDIYTQNLEYGKHNISEDNIFPSFNVLSVLKDIFETEGYNLIGNIFSTNNAQYFKSLYQTFQYSYDDYVKNKERPFFCKFEVDYTNFRIHKNASGNSYDISSTLQLTDLNGYNQESYDVGDKYEATVPSTITYGVDDPMQAGGTNTKFNVISDEKHMLARGKTDTNTGVIIIPKSGWYKINCNGAMNYPHKGHTIWGSGSTKVGGTTDEADNTDLSEQPFEFQIKKGMPMESPKFYSYNSLSPCVPTDFVDDNIVLFNCDDTWLKYQESDKQRRYGKNGGTTLINNYSNYPTNDFVCGARLGDAWFNARDDWNKCYKGPIRRPNRFVQFGACLTLPDVTKSIVSKEFDDELLECQGGRSDTKIYGKKGTYIKLSDKNNTLSYGRRTAQVMVKYNADPLQSSYSNFEGYNQLNANSWDTTSNYGKITYEGAESSSASTSDNYNGQWTINTVVWLEEGDTLYTEVLIPAHYKADYVEPGTSTSSEWEHQVEYVNTCNVKFDMTIGFLNSRSDWKPKPNDGVNTWNEIGEERLTNVNQFLPNTKCNDYLEKFLKTFNLQLTMINKTTFSIDSNINLNMMRNVIDIDKLTNVEDATFKPLETDSIRQLCWKNDLSETGYLQGNQSPYLRESAVKAWDKSGYTGNYTIENETNTSGSIKKTESQWSYNWYKTIKFIGSKYQTVGGTNMWSSYSKYYYGDADIPVITDTEIWKQGSNYYAYGSEKLKTNKTSRLFFVNNSKKSVGEYIHFTYDVYKEESTNREIDKDCNLVIPKKYIYDHNGTIDWLYNCLTYDKDSLGDGTWTADRYETITDVFFKNLMINGGYEIEVPIKLSNKQYADTNVGTLFKLNDGLYRVKRIEGHDVNQEDDATLTLTTLR